MVENACCYEQITKENPGSSCSNGDIYCEYCGRHEGGFFIKKLSVELIPSIYGNVDKLDVATRMSSIVDLRYFLKEISNKIEKGLIEIGRLHFDTSGKIPVLTVEYKERVYENQQGKKGNLL